MTSALRPVICAALLALTVTTTTSVQAQEEAARETRATTETAPPSRQIDLTVPVGAQSGRFGIGTGSSWPAYGVSGTYRVTDQITAEAILGLFGAIQSITGRGWYRFQQDPTYDLYAFGTAGIMRYDYIIDTESSLGLGGGVGIEFSWAKILDNADFPPIFSNIDIGLVLANFDRYNWSGFSFGGGIHYRF